MRRGKFDPPRLLTDSQKHRMMVLGAGLEPASCEALVPKTSVYTNSTTPALYIEASIKSPFIRPVKL